METALGIDSTEIILNQDFNTQIMNHLGHDVDPSFLGWEASRLELKSCIVGKYRGKQISHKVVAWVQRATLLVKCRHLNLLILEHNSRLIMMPQVSASVEN